MPKKEPLPKPRRVMKNVSYDDANTNMNFNSTGKNKDVPSFLQKRSLRKLATGMESIVESKEAPESSSNVNTFKLNLEKAASGISKDGTPTRKSEVVQIPISDKE